MSVLTKPYPHQLEDVRRVYREFGGRGDLFWDPGLGKSFGAILMAYRYGLRKTTLVICPACVKETWRREVKKHLGVEAVVLSGRKPWPGFRPKPGAFVVVNYDILGSPYITDTEDPTWAQVLLSLGPDLLVVDEGQYCKNLESVRTKSVMELSREVPHMLVLTGTPILNRPWEMFPILNMTNPAEWDSAFDYGARYCAMYKNEYGQWDRSGSSNLEELHERVFRTTACRRRREDVIKDLPPKVRTVVPVDLPPRERRSYDELVDDFSRWYTKKFLRYGKKGKSRSKYIMAGMVKLGYMKRHAAASKLPLVKEWLRNFLETSDRKILVCGIHYKVLRPLQQHFRKCSVLVNGQLPPHLRQSAFDRFNTDPNCRVLFGNIDAAGTGWSCSGADDVLKVEQDWVPGKHIQFEDRCLGIGRGTGKGRSLQVNYMVAKDTVEEKLCEVNQRKMEVVEKVMDGKVSGQLKLFDLLAKALLKGKKKKVRK